MADDIRIWDIVDCHEVLGETPDRRTLCICESSIVERSDRLDPERIVIHIGASVPRRYAGVPEDIRGVADLVCTAVGIDDEVA